MSTDLSLRIVEVGIVVCIVGIVGTLAWAATRPDPPPPPCSAYANWMAASVPARCTKTFDGERP